MSMRDRTTVVGVFHDRLQADRAIDSLYNAGFESEAIGLAKRDIAGAVHPETTNEAVENAETGAMAGVAAGLGIGGLVGLGVIAGFVPVIGPAIAGGTLGAILLSNVAGGAAVAGLAGALIGWGIPEEEARLYESEVSEGKTILTVAAGSRASEARQILTVYGATTRESLSL